MFVSFAYRDFKDYTLKFRSPDYSVLEREAGQPLWGQKKPHKLCIVNSIFKDSKDNSQKHKVKKNELGRACS